jgi:L-ascorbate metabolism protein UlaG (beta-lactamase superfamily)
MIRQQPFFDGEKFYNYPGEQVPAFLFSSIKMYIRHWLTYKPEQIRRLRAWHADTTASLPCDAFTRSDIAITWLGHATFLLQHHAHTIITDPVFESLTFLFPRLVTPGMMRHELPALDAVYISHNHRDHLERSTIEFLKKHSSCIFYVPRGDDYWLRSWNVPEHRIVTNTWWDQHAIPTRHASVEHCAQATFLPARHWSQRSWYDTNRSLWGSWMFTIGDHTIYFAGDTAYGTHFAEIGDAFPHISCALMPIGPCEPSAFLKKSHISAEEAGCAFQELRAQTFIPMHWGTYGFGVEAPLLPLQRITAWWQQNNLTQQLVPLRSGASHYAQPYAHQVKTPTSLHATL